MPTTWYKPRMRKWMRDRNKRRKPNPKEQGTATDAPAPLQPSLDRGEFEQSIPDDIGNRADEPEPASGPYESRQGTDNESRRGDRTRRRGRRGRGSKSRGAASQPAPTLPSPGGPTGEAAEAADLPVESPAHEPVHAEPAAAQAEASAEQTAKKRQPKGAVVLAIGLPGSGKSTWFRRHSIIPLSSDLMRTLLFDDVTEQRYQDLVFSTLRSLLRARMIAKRPWNYVDATNLSPKERRSWIRLAHDFGYEAHAVFFDVPTEICMERNRKRGRNVPDEIIQRMAAKLRAPKFEEGFAKITVVKLKKSASDGAAAPAAFEEPAEPEAPIASGIEPVVDDVDDLPSYDGDELDDVAEAPDDFDQNE